MMRFAPLGAAALLLGVLSGVAAGAVLLLGGTTPQAVAVLIPGVMLLLLGIVLLAVGKGRRGAEQDRTERGADSGG